MVLYGYTESDEISLLFHPEETAYSRKLRKYHSVLAGEASAKFSHLLGDVAAFDCRISQLPRKEDVVDYFRWRNEDAHRNALSAHCYWMLRKQGHSAQTATAKINGLSVAQKNELLFQNGINYNNLPSWQKRGIGLFWEEYQREGFNPARNEPVYSTRRRIAVEMELPMHQTYDAFILAFLEEK